MNGNSQKGVPWEVSSADRARRLERIEGPSERRRRSDREKARIVAKSLVPVVRPAAVLRLPGDAPADGARLISAFAAFVVELPKRAPGHDTQGQLVQSADLRFGKTLFCRRLMTMPVFPALSGPNA